MMATIDPTLASKLRDIHLPEANFIWPLAPIWWFIIVLVTALICFLLYRITVVQNARHTAKKLPLTLAKAQLKQIRNNQQPNIAQLQATNRLLRQASISLYGHSAVAKLTGHQWQTFLLNTAGMNSGDYQAASHALAFDSYQNPVDIPIQQVFDFTATWLDQHIKRHKRLGGDND